MYMFGNLFGIYFIILSKIIVKTVRLIFWIFPKLRSAYKTKFATFNQKYGVIKENNINAVVGTQLWIRLSMNHEF